MLIFSTTSYEYLLDAIIKKQNKHESDHLFLHKGEIKRSNFPDGESYHCFLSEISDQQVIIIGGTISDSETLELYDMACHCAKAGARTITIIIPYYGYSTMERAVKSGEIVKAKTRARLLSSIPFSFKLKIAFIDLHSEGIPHYLEGNIQPVHLYGKKVIMEMAKKISGVENFVLASTDAGRAKWVESLANDMKVDCAVITKRRSSGSETEIVGINADVKDKIVVIYDDMIRTGGSLINAGTAYKNAGASKVYAIATHGILPNDSIFKLKASGVFEKVATTDTHPNANMLSGMPSLKEFYEVYSMDFILYKFCLNEIVILNYH